MTRKLDLDRFVAAGVLDGYDDKHVYYSKQFVNDVRALQERGDLEALNRYLEGLAALVDALHGEATEP